MRQDLTCCDPCRVPLVMTIERPGMEWKCPKCGRFTAFFDDGHCYIKEEALSEEGQKFWNAQQEAKP